MNCKEFEELLLNLPPASAWPRERASAAGFAAHFMTTAGREHAASCDRCAVALTRRLALFEALGSLEAVPVDSDLEGRVVAAMQPGHRQERVIARLDALEPVGAPEALDHAVRRLFTPHPAPAILDRLVRERVERAAARPEAALEWPSTERPPRGASRLWQATWLAGAAAAALVLWIGVQGTGDSPARPLKLDFEVVHVTSLDQASLDGFLREQVVGLAGFFPGGDKH